MSSEFAADSAAEVDDATAPVAETESQAEDAILDRFAKKETEEAPVDEPVAGEEAKGETKPAVEAKTEPKAEEKLPDERLDPQELKAVFKKYPGLRQEHYTLAAYKEVFPNVQAAREIRNIFPSKEDAEEARGAAEKLLQLDADFRANPSGFVKELHAADAQAFYKLASRFPSEIYNIDPRAYDAYVVKPVLGEFQTQFRGWAQANGDEELIAALDVVDQRLGRNNSTRQAPAIPDNDPRLAKLREYERMEEERQAQGSDQFYNSAGDAVKSSVTKEVSEIVDRAGSTLSQGARNEIINKVVDEVGDILSSDSYLQKRIQFFARAGKPDDSQLRDNVVRLMMTKARTVLREKTQDKINWMTRDILSLQEPKKASRFAAKRDPGDGGRTSPGAKPRPRDTSHMTPDEILDAFSKD